MKPVGETCSILLSFVPPYVVFVSYITYFAFKFFPLLTHALSLSNFDFSYLMKPVGETSLILLSVVLPSVHLLITTRQYFSSYISAGTSSLLGATVHPLSSFLRASVLPSAGSTLPCVQPPTFFRFLTFLY